MFSVYVTFTKYLTRASLSFKFTPPPRFASVTAQSRGLSSAHGRDFCQRTVEQGGSPLVSATQIPLPPSPAHPVREYEARIRSTSVLSLT
ncbi:hypothetical protein WG66_008477 [Moniliophthora roreri]|nr:hypothetical protein WG66_008477 [Moniliophthora roreri]